jgi:histidyl-tRNA synthetase
MLQAAGAVPPPAPPDAYALVPDPASLPRVMPVLDALRAAGLAVSMHAAGKDGQGSFKSQLRKADASGARHALIFGADELALGEVAIKPLRDASAAQRSRPLADAHAWAHELRDA